MRFLHKSSPSRQSASPGTGGPSNICQRTKGVDKETDPVWILPWWWEDVTVPAVRICNHSCLHAGSGLNLYSLRGPGKPKLRNYSDVILSWEHHIVSVRIK